MFYCSGVCPFFRLGPPFFYHRPYFYSRHPHFVCSVYTLHKSSIFTFPGPLIDLHPYHQPIIYRGIKDRPDRMTYYLYNFSIFYPLLPEYSSRDPYYENSTTLFWFTLTDPSSRNIMIQNVFY